MKELRNKTCAQGYYKDISVVLHGALVCCGGFGQPQCKYYIDCLKNNGIKLSKSGRRIKIK
jgi:hypothetical protein